jgi:hypothetical protein
MSNKLILTALVLGLLFGAAGFLVVAPAQDKGPFKSPRSTRPLSPTRPQDSARPSAAEDQPSFSPTQLTAPMADIAIQKALAKRVDLDLTAAPFSEAVAAIKRQTDLEIRVAPDALNPKDGRARRRTTERNDKSTGKSMDDSSDDSIEDSTDEPTDKPAEKPADKPADRPADKSHDKLAYKSTDKPTEKTADKPAEKKIDKAAEKPAGKTAAAEPVVSVHLKGISAASALDLMLHDVGLSWSVDRGGILITTPDRSPVTTAVYDVRDLVVAHPAFDNRDDTVDFQYEPLTSLITGVIQCPGWAGDIDKVQDCNPFHGTLTVRQDQQVQQKVAGLLAALRKARDFPSAQYAASANLGLSIVGADNSAVAAALDVNVDAAFSGAKFEQVVDWIRHTCGIPVHVDSAVRVAGQDSQTFTLKASGVSLRALLKALLPQARLAYSVADETLVITTRDAVADWRSIRVYPVGDLIGGEVDRHGIDDDYAELLDSITHNVQPDSWAALDRQKPYSSTGSAYAAYLPSGRALVVDQTSTAHEEIAATLGKLRAAVASQPVAAKPLATDDKPQTNQPEPAKRFLSMRIYKLNPDLPAEDFAKVVRDLVEPKSWTAETYLHGVPGAIVVKQSPAVHKRIERLLIELGAIPDPKKSGTSGTPILIGGHKRA